MTLGPLHVCILFGISFREKISLVFDLFNAEDLPPSGMLSRHDMHNYLSRDDDRGEPQPLKDTSTIGSAYDRYLQSAVLS